MLNELSKSTNAGKTYSIKYSYPGSGWGTPIYDIVLEEQSNNNEEVKLFNINSINVIVPNSLLGYINGLEVDYVENAEGNLTLKIIY
jgi:Fe-S cluster assembly iron-binding protein IscA